MKTAKIRFLLILFAFLLLGAGLGEIKLSKCEPKSGIVTIAFDDGTYNQFTNAFPLMQEHGFVGTYNVITGLVGRENYLSLSNLHALANAGNEIASHTVNHPDLSKLDDAAIDFECKASKQFLQANGFQTENFASQVL